MSARVLVVDDVPANVKLLEARLSAEYFDVITACNGTQALEICSRAECDIILLDVMMPDMDGFEVCRRLKSNPATHFIPVVMVTALDSPADRWLASPIIKSGEATCSIVAIRLPDCWDRLPCSA